MPSDPGRRVGRLLDIVENVDAALEFVTGHTYETFCAHRMVNYATVRALEMETVQQHLKPLREVIAAEVTRLGYGAYLPKPKQG